ncbi:MAG: hypothetical protein M1812_001474 [Candelaria pacifica]|nr:MAG: hypothetical protein M1812_001474 [Candelaria pacifica]
MRLVAPVVGFALFLLPSVVRASDNCKCQDVYNNQRDDLTQRCCISGVNPPWSGGTYYYPRDMGDGVIAFEDMTSEQQQWVRHYDQGNAEFRDDHSEVSSI